MKNGSISLAYIINDTKYGHIGT